MDKFIEIIKKFRPVDSIIIIGVIIALVVGFFTYKNFRQTADKQIEATSKISFQVFIRGVTLTGSEIPLSANEKTFISIRNVPYSDLDIVDHVIDMAHGNTASVNGMDPASSTNQKVTIYSPYLQGGTTSEKAGGGANYYSDITCINQSLNK